MRSPLVVLWLMVLAATARAENASFTLLRTASVEELDRILDAERTVFLQAQKPGPGYVLPAPSKARNAVELYTVRYESKVPERGAEKVVVTGLVALPVVADRAALPLVAYQHGTVFGKYEVPSFSFQRTSPGRHPHYDGAYETRHMVAQFAGNGYALVAADYFGMGARPTRRRRTS